MNLTIMLASHIGVAKPVTVRDILAKMQERFEAIKASNPRGFMDQFEQQLDVIIADIAKSLNANVSRHGDSVMFNFTIYPNDMLEHIEPVFPSKFRKRKEHEHNYSF